MWETWVQSLCQEDLLEKEMEIHSSILAWKVPWMKEPRRLQSTGLQRVRHDWATSLSLSFSPFSFFFFKIFVFTLFCFTILYWFCYTLTWIRQRCTWVPNPEPPSHFLPHTISLGHPSAPAPSILYPVSNLDWRFVSYIILYMFQCNSPKSSHPFLLAQSLKVSSIHLCLFCCLTYRVIITIFLNSIYMH